MARPATEYPMMSWRARNGGGRTGKRATVERFTRWVAGWSSASTTAVTELASVSVTVKGTNQRRLGRAALMFYRRAGGTPPVAALNVKELLQAAGSPIVTPAID